MATFWERVAHSVYRMFSFWYFNIVILVISHFGFEGGTLVLISSVPGHSLSFTFHMINLSIPSIFKRSSSTDSRYDNTQRYLPM